MDNIDFLEVWKNKLDDIIVPDSLKPKSIETILETIENDKVVSMDVRRASRNGRKRLFKGVIAVAFAAAVILLLLAEPLIRHNILVYKYLNTDKNGLLQPKNYEELSRFFMTNKEENERITFSEWVDSKVAYFEALDDEPSYGSAGNSSTPDYGISNANLSNSNKFSETNVRVDGVNESDWVKTDGEYIYALNEGVLKIYKADGAATEYVSKYFVHLLIREDKTFDNLGYVTVVDMLLYEDKLIFIGESVFDNKNITAVAMFDISDVSNIELVSISKIEGNYKECRMLGNYLYVCTVYKFNDYDVDSIIPKLNDEEIAYSHVYVADDDSYKSYYTMSSYLVDDELKPVDCVIVANDGNIDAYVTESNIYLLSKKFYEGEDYIGILKFAYSNGKFQSKAVTVMGGWIENIFCVDEYNDNLRIVITNGKRGKETNSLYVFDENLKKTGKLTKMAYGEEVDFIRFVENVGYIATSKEDSGNVLYTIDLSKAKKPEIIEEFELKGSAKYMHMWDDNLMIGIGDINYDTKLSIYDVSEPTNVKELNGNIFDFWEPSVYGDYKAIFADREKNIIGLDVTGTQHSYYIFSYENEELIEKFNLDCCSEADEDGVFYANYMESTLRGLYVDEYIYIVCKLGKIRVVDMNTFEVVTEIMK